MPLWVSALAVGGEQVLPLAGRCGEQRLVAVERAVASPLLPPGWRALPARALDRVGRPGSRWPRPIVPRPPWAAAPSRPMTASASLPSDSVTSNPVLVAGLGREGQGEGDGPLVDQRAVGAVGQQSLNLRHDPVAGNQSREAVGDVLGGGDGRNAASAVFCGWRRRTGWTTCGQGGRGASP